MLLNIENTSQSSYLSFIIGNETFAIPIQQVHEILELQRITKVPKTSKHIMGVINRRGDILPVIDTHSIFNIKRNNTNETYEIMVMEIETGEKKVIIGALIDSARDVIEISSETISPVPEIGGVYESHFFKGAKQIDNHFVLLIDPNSVFAVERFL